MNSKNSFTLDNFTNLRDINDCSNFHMRSISYPATNFLLEEYLDKSDNSEYSPLAILAAPKSPVYSLDLMNNFLDSLNESFGFPVARKIPFRENGALSGSNLLSSKYGGYADLELGHYRASIPIAYFELRNISSFTSGVLPSFSNLSSNESTLRTEASLILYPDYDSLENASNVGSDSYLPMGSYMSLASSPPTRISFNSAYYQKRVDPKGNGDAVRSVLQGLEKTSNKK